ncbi:MAG: hypothetical protein IJM23_05075 [Lachnospiraceae bacterium]|nr:hypothetical protein [Lachnospiraceae bacterium]
MAKDDHNIIIFKILVYLYAVFKGSEVFEQEKYDKAINRKDINEEYLFKLYKMMSDEGFIEKLPFKKAWGGDLIPLFDESDMTITYKGIRYLEENDSMKKRLLFFMTRRIRS